MVASSSLLWAVALVVGVFLAHWGAERFSAPLKKLRRQWGLTAVAGGAFVGLAAASPEIGINAVSASRGVSDIGLGVAFGSNVVAIPLMVSTAYLASRARLRDDGDAAQTAEHRKHRRRNLLRVKRNAVTVLALPYLGIVAVVAALTLPAPWRGIQAVDGVVLALAYAVFLGQAVLRGRSNSESVTWEKREVALAGAGVAVVGLGTYLTVRATEHVVAALGISNLVGGLFVTAIVATAPELFATWSVVRSGQVTAGTASVLGDHAVTLTVAFVPLAFVGVPVENFRLFWVNLLFVAAMPAAYAALLHWGPDEHGFERWQVVVLDAVYVVYVAVVAFWVLDVA